MQPTTLPPDAEPLTPGIFTWPSDEPRLLAGRCADCGTIVFPRPAGCQRCTSTAIDEVELGDAGTLWSWTIQHFPPKSPPFVAPPGGFEPYGVGYIELPGELRVEARLTTADPEELRIGMPMALTIIHAGEVDGVPRLTYAFRPATS